MDSFCFLSFLGLLYNILDLDGVMAQRLDGMYSIGLIIISYLRQTTAT